MKPVNTRARSLDMLPLLGAALTGCGRNPPPLAVAALRARAVATRQDFITVDIPALHALNDSWDLHVDSDGVRSPHESPT